MVEEIIDVGTSKFNIEEIWFKKFCNKYEKELLHLKATALFIRI